MGVTVTDPIKYIDLNLTHYILPPHRPNVGNQYYRYFTHPLQAQAAAQRYNASSPSYYLPLILR
jgi:hypothetical protein